MDNRGQIIIGKYSRPEFEYLKNNEWIFTEKVDGTNIRIEWRVGLGVKIGGRTDNAQIPTFLIKRLDEIFSLSKFERTIDKNDTLCLYGEGYGAKIQRGGGNYKSDGVDFVLFDVLIGDWWLQRKDVEDIANKLDIDVVPIVGRGSLMDAVEKVQKGFESTWGQFYAEGIVLRPLCELKSRAGNRIITKIKHKDFN